jgi:hypothetical protein
MQGYSDPFGWKWTHRCRVGVREKKRVGSESGHRRSVDSGQKVVPRLE